jgi:Na+:H+ antiporter, NhaA family
MSPGTPAETRLFSRPSWPEASRLADVLRKETVGGAVLLVATAVALAWVNSPWSGSYRSVRDAVIGPSALHLDLSIGVWAADGLLAVFFFVAGLELKREFVAGDLRDPASGGAASGGRGRRHDRAGGPVPADQLGC